MLVALGGLGSGSRRGDGGVFAVVVLGSALASAGLGGGTGRDWARLLAAAGAKNFARRAASLLKNSTITP